MGGALRPRASLRVRVILAIALVALAPHLLILAWSQLDRPVAGRLWFNVVDAMNKAVSATASGAPFTGIAISHGVRLRVVDVDGVVLLDQDEDGPISNVDRVEAFFLRPSGVPALRELDATWAPMVEREEVRAAQAHSPFVRCEFQGLLYCEAITSVKDPAGREMIVHVQQSSFRAVGPVYQLRSQLLRIGLLIWPLAAILAWFTGSRIVRPLERLRRQAIEKSRQASPRLVHEESDEVGDLATALNTAFATIESERLAHERFVEDLVHELKSPTASVRACADTLGDAPDADARSKRIANVLKESGKKLDATVSRFLDVARAEAGFPKEERDTVDLSSIATAVVSSFDGDSRFVDVSFQCHAPNPVLVSGVEYRLLAMVRELVDNGASFVERGGNVRVLVRAKDGEAIVVVEDDGPGIPPDELLRVFDRYYTTRGQTRGTGLGLALVGAVARAHAGRARALPDRDKGAAFEVRLPLFTPN